MVTGYFDVLRAAHTCELAEARRRGRAETLLAVVLPRAGEVLPQKARAEMVAALRVVDYVLTARAEDVESLAAALRPADIARLEQADDRRAKQLIDHVHRRQAC